MLKRLSSDASGLTGIAALPLMRPIDIAGLARKLWRHKIFIVLGALLFSVLALIYSLAATPLYTSSVSILIEPRQPIVLADQPSLANEQIEAAYVDSQVEILKSGKVLQRAISAQNLLKDEEFASEAKSVFGMLLGAILQSSTPSSDALMTRVAGNLRQRLDIKRVGLTYVLSVVVTTRSPQKSADVANAIAAAFLQDNLEARSEAAHSAAGWLQSRAKELRDLAVAADASVQDFRARNNIVTAGQGLMTDQEVSEISTQLTLARSQLSEVQAKYDKLGAALSGGQSSAGAVPSDLPSDSIVPKLQSAVIDNNLRIAELAKVNGQNHRSVQRLKAENISLEASIKDELRRIGESYKNDLDIAQERVRSIENSLKGAVGTSNIASSAQVRLRDLERESEAYRTIYQLSLSKLQEATQQQSFPVSGYRVITAAAPMPQKSWPKSILIIGLAALAGTAAGAMASLYSASRDTTLRSPIEVGEAFGGKCIASVPLSRKPPDLPSLVNSSAPSPLLSSARSVKLFLRGSLAGEPCIVIGVTSTHRGEGRSTLAAGLAASYAASAFRTLLIDADFHHPHLTQSLAPKSSRGFQDVLADDQEAEISILEDQSSGVHFLPAGPRSMRALASHDSLGGANVFKVMSQLRDRYDVVIVDTAPLAASMDALAMAPLVDAFVYVVEWGKTQAAQSLQYLNEAEDVKSRVMGYVLTKVPGRSRIADFSATGERQPQPAAQA
jgi:polysaccharide biosynthesis transport protein